MRSIWSLSLCSAMLVLPAAPKLLAHHAEPISTEFARPFRPGAGNLKLVYEYEREPDGARAHTIPEFELELGAGSRWQLNFGFPLVRVKEGPDEPAALAGGKLELGFRYLLLGSDGPDWAVSFQGTLEAPTGNRQLFGRSTEISPGLFAERYLSPHLRLHANLSWRTTLGQTDDPERVLDYRSALVWFASHRWIPVIEFLGATSTRSGETEFAIQPELILYAGPHLELKLGAPLGLTSNTPDIGLRAQISILWGQRR